MHDGPGLRAGPVFSWPYCFGDLVGLRQTTAPETEPITLAELKAHLRVDIDDEDDLLTSLLVAARQAVEHRTRRQMLTATWTLTLPGFPSCGRIELPYTNLQSVTGVSYADLNGAAQTLAASDYRVITATDPGFVVLAPTSSWPATEVGNAEPVTVVYVAGYGEDAADVPEALRHAIKLLAAHWYWHRESASEDSVRPVPDTIDWLLAQYKVIA